MNFKGLLISAVLISVFVIAIISFGINLSANNETNVSITDEPKLTALTEVLEENIISSRETTDASWTGIGGSAPSETSDLGIVEITSLAAALPRFAWTMFITIMDLLAAVLHVPVSILYGLTTILLIVIFTSIWSFIRSGK